MTSRMRESVLQHADAVDPVHHARAGLGAAGLAVVHRRGVIATQALAVGLGGTVVAARRSRRLHAEAVRSDDETGLLTYRAFIDVLDQAARCSDGCAPFTIVCLTVDGFEHTALSLGWDARRAYLGSVKGEIDAVVHGDYEAARVSAGFFAIAIREYVDRRALGDLMRALELALLWKVRIDGKKAFCMARSAAVRFLRRRRPRGARGAHGVAAGARPPLTGSASPFAPSLPRKRTAPSEDEAVSLRAVGAAPRLSMPLPSCGVGELLEARDVGAHDVVALVAVLLGGAVGRMVDVLHDLLQLAVHFLERPGQALGVLRHPRPGVATPPAFAALPGQNTTPFSMR